MVKPLKDVRKHIGRDARPGIPHSDGHRPFGGGRRHLNRRPGRRVHESVVGQDKEHLLESVAVTRGQQVGWGPVV